MISIIITIFFLLFAWRFGDWKNWKQYYPSMLYMVLNAIIFNLITYEHPTWEWNDITGVFPNHTLLDVWIIFTQFPAVVLLYLTNYPKTWIKKSLRILLWAGIFTALELIVFQFDYIVYHNNWTLWWSIFFNIVTFIMIRLHFRRPLLTWLLSIVFITLLSIVFDLPLSKLR
jgi:hypothetical protein